MRSLHGGRHELGQSFLVHTPTLRGIRGLVAETHGPILELGPGDGALTAQQWEVARKRAGVGGVTMMTAQTAPWYEFTLHGRVPAHRFRPMPSVDGGILSPARWAALWSALSHS